MIAAWRCLTFAPSLPAASLSSAAAAAFSSSAGDRQTPLPGAPLSRTAVIHWRSLGAAPRPLPSLHRRPYCLGARCHHGSDCRGISSSSPSPVTPGVTAAHASASSPAPARRDRYVCPECGKRFLCESNLVRHRAARHGVEVASASEVAQAQLAARNAQLQEELARVQARVKQLRDGGGSPSQQEHDGATTGLADDAARTYPSAVLTGRLMEVDEAVERAWRDSGRGLGTGVSFMKCVGTVVGPVEVGTLRGTATADSVAAGPRVLQFVIEAHGYQERRPGQLKMYRAHILVRYVAWQPYHRYGDDHGATAPAPPSAALLPFKVQEGDVLHVQGHYALHKSYDMVSKQSLENVVVEADAVGMLRPAPAPVAATVREEKATRAAAVAVAPSALPPVGPPPSSAPSLSRPGATPAGTEVITGTGSHRQRGGNDSVVVSTDALLLQQQKRLARKTKRRARTPGMSQAP
ncbi:hypothetical protein LSCM1_08219 [Leishmania martiniquensis]|uniref:C2H2-type domain-containing protein n=1 Tax=Leishmania martiniquensis TaxID=1580590 RepID=A0A836KZ08_9TRYP|nr:hypothetical protein LSCM1_08219 [Leishmania martiniquensis]